MLLAKAANEKGEQVSKNGFENYQTKESYLFKTSVRNSWLELLRLIMAGKVSG